MSTTRTATASGPRPIGEGVGQPTGEGVGQMGTELARVDTQVRAFVKERPVLALLGAVAAGYLFGRLVRRLG